MSSHAHRPSPRRLARHILPVLVAASLTTTLVAAQAAPASAAPVVEGTQYERITFSNDTVTPGQTFTVRVEHDRTATATSILFSFSLGGSQWSYVGCAPFGNATGCSYPGSSSVLAYGGNVAVGGAEFTFAVNSNATGTIPYGGSVYTSPSGEGTVSYDGSLAIAPPPEADIAVGVAGAPQLGLLPAALQFTLTATNNGPDPVSSATLTATIPSGVTATNLSTGCTQTGTTIACTYGAIANGAHTDKTFRLPLGLLSLGQMNVTATRTASTPTDPNSTNDTASDTCTVISILLASC